MREVLEETGWDLEGQLREEDCVEAGWSPAAAATGGGSASLNGSTLLVSPWRQPTRQNSGSL